MRGDRETDAMFAILREIRDDVRDERDRATEHRSDVVARLAVIEERLTALPGLEETARAHRELVVLRRGEREAKASERRSLREWATALGAAAGAAAFVLPAFGVRIP